MKPYTFWDRDQLFSMLIDQALWFQYDEKYLDFIRTTVYDERWNPSEDYNGCNIVQDNLHPFLPCFVHDWRWITKSDALEADKEFKENLIKCGFKKWKAHLYYVAVRIGWHLFYKWKK
jgi:hypothetical protein